MAEETLYGIHAVIGALKNRRRRISKILVDEHRQDGAAQQIMTLAERCGITLEPVNRAQLNRLLGHTKHQGVAALVQPLAYGSLRQMSEQIADTEGAQTLLILDGVTDVGNFASLIRSAVAFGVDTIVIPRNRSVALTSAVAKRSSGAIERVSVVRVVNIATTLDELKQQGFWIYGAGMKGELRVAQIQWPERLAIVLGAEGDGMRRLVRERCDALVRIPMRPGSNSLNVGVAGAIFLAYAWEHRSNTGIVDLDCTTLPDGRLQC